MMDLEATFTISSGQAEAAIKRVIADTDRLARTGKQAEQSIRSLNSSFGSASKEASSLRLSAEKAGIGFKSLVTGVLDSKQPIMDLAMSMSYLTRAFKVGVAGTVGVVAIAEVIKGLTKENEKLNEITKSLDGTLSTFSKTISTISFEGAISQANALGDALDKAFEKLEEPGFIERLGRGVSDLFTGGAKRRTSEAIAKTAGAVETSKAIAEERLQREIELKITERTNKLEAQRSKIRDKFALQQREAIKQGFGESYLQKLRIKEGLEILQLEEDIAKESKKAGEEAVKAQKEKADATRRALEEAIKSARTEQDLQQQNADLFKKYADEQIRKNKQVAEERAKAEKDAEDSITEASIKAARTMDEIDAKRAKQRTEQEKILMGSAAGRQALAAARLKAERQAPRRAFREEEVAVRERQTLENEQRKAKGLPLLDVGAVRRRMAEEAVGLPSEQALARETIKGRAEPIEPAGGSLEEIQRRFGTQKPAPTSIMEEFNAIDRMFGRGATSKPIDMMQRELPSYPDIKTHRGFNLMEPQGSQSQSKDPEMVGILKSIEKYMSLASSAPLVTSGSGRS